MDFLLLHQIYTLLLFILFIGIFGWAWSDKRQPSFHEASRLPFSDDPAGIALTAYTCERNCR